MANRYRNRSTRNNLNMCNHNIHNHHSQGMASPNTHSNHNIHSRTRSRVKWAISRSL
jgi:hypothetical protein